MNIKKHIAIPLFSLSLAFFFVSNTPVFADMSIVRVPQSCSVSDTDGGVHDYSGQYFGICALVAAKDQGIISSYTFQNFSFGLFLASINGVSPSDTEFWNIALNGIDASVGLSDLVLAQGDTLTFQRKDFISNTYVGESVAFAVSLQESREGGGSGGGQVVITFDIGAALSFLSEKQEADGSFGPTFITDWVAIALASLSGQGADQTETRDRVRAYILSNTAPMATITDYERHAMALMALDINPYTGTATDYITPIVDAYDGTQIGNASLVNDDIFALFPLTKAGYDSDSSIVKNTVAFILTKQGSDGAWERSVDLTAAAIQALSPFTSVPDVASALTKARAYLQSTRGLDGSWNNSFEMSWVVQALHASNEPLSSWIQDGKSPMSALASTQESDGGVEPTTSDSLTRIWATAYAIPAALAKPWNDILHSFSKPITTGIVLGVVATTSATTTEAVIATSTDEKTVEPIAAIQTIIESSNQQNSVPSPKSVSSGAESKQDAIEEIPPFEDATTSSQLAAASTAVDQNFVPFLIMPILLILSALWGAFGIIPLMRLFKRLFLIK